MPARPATGKSPAGRARLASGRCAPSSCATADPPLRPHRCGQAPYPALLPCFPPLRPHPLVQTAIQAYKSQFDDEPEIGTWKFSTNGVASKGMFDIPSIGFGPGSESHAHSPDDQIKIEDLVNAISFYAALTYNWIQG